jgi:ferric-dicitrate binding protein FerR (iron transport regulator)
MHGIMKDYRLFDISDFVLDDDFIRWVNNPKKADDDFWNDWLSANPDKYMLIAEARKILESFRTEELLISEQERETEINKLLHTITEGNIPDEMPEPRIPARVVSVSKKRWWFAAAAIVIGLVVTTGYFLRSEHKRSAEFAYHVVTPAKHLIESVNTSERTISLTLPDQSVVELAPDSRIAYPNNFDSNNTRDVYLSGEAFFKVTKNPARPFRVFANEIVTKVLGTSFIVRSFEADTVIQVTVKTGKVSVYSQANKTKLDDSSSQYSGIILTPNQELVYKRLEQQFLKSLLANPAEIIPRGGDQENMVYDEAPLEKVFGQLGKNYGINIVYDVELLKKCTVTADLRNESFYRKLDLICKAIGADYEIIDGQIVIVTKGCK